jgi:hypothetical protein
MVYGVEMGVNVKEKNNICTSIGRVTKGKRVK